MQVVHLPFRKNLFSRKRASGQSKFPAIAICCRRSRRATCPCTDTRSLFAVSQLVCRRHFAPEVPRHFSGAFKFAKVAVHGLLYRLLCEPPAANARAREAPELLAACLRRK